MTWTSDVRRRGGRRGRDALTAAALVVVGATTLAACGGDDGALPEGSSSLTTFPTDDPSSSAGSPGASGAPTEGATSAAGRAVADPCEALTPEEVGALVGLTVAETADGTDAARACSYTEPGADVPVLTITTFAAFAEIQIDDVLGDAEEGVEIVEVPVEGAEAARIVTDDGEDAVLMTGIVSHDGQFDLVNLGVPAPYDLPALQTSITTVLTALVANAAATD